MDAPGVPPARARGITTRWRGPAAATAVYTVAAILLTWPLATALGTSIPWDLGDPLLNAWIIAWGADHLWRFLCGDFAALGGYWHANIFHPAPYALAYSEHLFPQAVQAVPVWAVTRNPVLCYNLLFLSTFVLSGLGMYLLVGELTGDRRVALVGGFCYAFAPYRIGQYSHLQVLSSQWMPFALYGLKRYLDTGRLRALAGGAAAVVTQGLSCGYYLLFFAPVALSYIVFGLATRRRAPTTASLSQLIMAALLAAACTWPFVRPYLELRAIEFPERSLAEVTTFSADVQSYATAHAAQWVWGSRLRLHPRPEGELFPGVVVVLLAVFAAGAEIRLRWRDAHDLEVSGWQGLTATRVAMMLAAGAVLVVVAVIVTGGISMRVWGVRVRASGLYDAVLRAVAAAVVLLAISRRARAAARGWMRTETAWWVFVLVAAAALSCGPTLRNGTRVLEEAAPYAWLYHHVPGFDGLRVPARFAMLVALALSVLAALGLHRLTHDARRAGRWLAAAAVLVIAEGGAAPLPLNAGEPPGQFAVPGADLYVEGRPPAVYEALAAVPRDAVVLELPLGSPPWDVRAVFYSTVHWRRLVNGYSGGFPQRYVATAAALSRLEADPALAWATVRASGATHVIVHRAAYLNGVDAAVVQWLEHGGAARTGTFGSDVLYTVPR